MKSENQGKSPTPKFLSQQEDANSVTNLSAPQGGPTTEYPNIRKMGQQILANYADLLTIALSLRAIGDFIIEATQTEGLQNEKVQSER